MNEQKALELVHKIIFAVLKKKTEESLSDIYEKYAFDAKLPYQVEDSTTNEITWADAINADKYITVENSEHYDKDGGWKLKKEPISSFEDLMKYWNKINYVTTERVYDSENVSKSDTIYRCQNVYHSTNCNDSKNLIFCNGTGSSENMLASHRSFRCINCIRTDDSTNCSNCYNVICSNKISNSLFIQDCANMDECMFCAHLSNCHYYICNMEFDEKEYFKIKEAIIEWILHS